MWHSLYQLVWVELYSHVHKLFLITSEFLKHLLLHVTKVMGNDRVNPEGWDSVVAGGTAVPQYYIYSATNIRLQEASIGYTIPRKWLGNVCDIKVSLIGRNLWMIYNKAPFDPESVASTDNFYQGIDYFMMPSLRNIGFNLSFKF